MTLTLEELLAFPKEVRSSKCARSNNAKIVRNTSLLEAISKEGSLTSYTTEDGKLKIKIMVKKQDLKQMLEAMNNGIDNGININSIILPKTSPSSIEMRLYDLMKTKKASQAKERQPRNWRPALQSIPEEH
ncbi:hypothetical protein BVRB_9g213560 [Beta vulgaris subsp. vulgaris]|nr:hypothetical protein BVRB_9g213560 [Beta vulgaris subsp. vulgaris]